MSQQSNLEIRVVKSITAISENDWNRILPKDAGPFLQHAFLALLEETGCVSIDTGWEPSHLALYSTTDDELLGVMPLYLKTHSYGEYVFDWSWAEAYAMNGLNYYPKALSAIPFTPATGSRLLASSKEHQEYLINGLLQFLTQFNISSAHVLFPSSIDTQLLEQSKFLRREAIQFHWQNQQFDDFDQFLATLTMKRRKNIKRERQQVRDAGITFLQVPGEQMTEEQVLFSIVVTLRLITSVNRRHISINCFSKNGFRLCLNLCTSSLPSVLINLLLLHYWWWIKSIKKHTVVTGVRWSITRAFILKLLSTNLLSTASQAALKF